MCKSSKCEPSDSGKGQCGVCGFKRGITNPPAKSDFEDDSLPLIDAAYDLNPPSKRTSAGRPQPTIEDVYDLNPPDYPDSFGDSNQKRDRKYS